MAHFTTMEIAPWPLPEDDELAVLLADVEGEWKPDLHKRVVQHVRQPPNHSANDARGGKQPPV